MAYAFSRAQFFCRASAHWPARRCCCTQLSAASTAARSCTCRCSPSEPEARWMQRPPHGRRFPSPYPPRASFLRGPFRADRSQTIWAQLSVDINVYKRMVEPFTQAGRPEGSVPARRTVPAQARDQQRPPARRSPASAQAAANAQGDVRNPYALSRDLGYSFIQRGGPQTTASIVQLTRTVSGLC